MSELDNTTKIQKKQYKDLTKEQRSQIEILLNTKDKEEKRIFNNTYIAKAIGVDKSTISRELKNRIMSGKIKNKPYNVTDAQNDYNFKRVLSKAQYKLEKYPKMKKYIEDKILIDKWAPDVIIGYMKKNKSPHYL